MSVGDLLRERACSEPSRVALVDVAENGSRSEHTYGELDRDARAAAAALQAAGVPAGGRVALVAQNGRAYVTAWFGAIYAGCTVVPIPILSAVPEIAFRIGHARCDAAIADGARSAAVKRAIESLGSPIRVLAAEALAGGEPIDEPVAPAEDAMILYTSGTTGWPKGAAITHASLRAHTAALVSTVLRIDAEDRILGALPLAHSYGMRMVVLAAFCVGARAVIIGRFDAAMTMSLLEREGITFLPVVPTMLSAIGTLPREAERASFPRLGWCLSAGAPLADDVRERAEARLGVLVRQGYGLTEATFSTIDAPPAERTIGSVGRAVPGVEVRTTDEDGRDVPTGSTGEVRVRGRNVMRGYIDDEEATAAVMGDGWVRTGDVGRLDAEGRLFVVDRIKDMILRAGHNVYPSEVEAVISRHPAIEEVAVVGRPDAHYGEEIVAVVVLRPGATLDLPALDAYCRESLAPTKVPREIAVVDALPLGPSRKILKRALRAQIAEGALRPTRIS